MDHHVGAAERALHPLLDVVGHGVGLAHAGVERHAHDDVDEVAPGRVAHAHAPQLDLLVEPGERVPDSLVGIGRRCGP